MKNEKRNKFIETILETYDQGNITEKEAYEYIKETIEGGIILWKECK